MSAAESFFDTNVLLYLLSDEKAKADRAETLLAEGGCISVQVLNEFTSVALRKLGLSIAELRDILDAVRGVCRVLPVDEETHDLGLDLIERHRFATFDAFILAAALQGGCRVLYSEDMQDGRQLSGLVIRNPFGPAF